MNGCMTSPNIGFKKLLLKRFELLEVNKYNISKLYNKTFKELTNVSVRRKKHKKHLIDFQFTNLLIIPVKCLHSASFITANNSLKVKYTFVSL